MVKVTTSVVINVLSAAGSSIVPRTDCMLKRRAKYPSIFPPTVSETLTIVAIKDDKPSLKLRHIQVIRSQGRSCRSELTIRVLDKQVYERRSKGLAAYICSPGERVCL